MKMTLFMTHTVKVITVRQRLAFTASKNNLFVLIPQASVDNDNEGPTVKNRHDEDDLISVLKNSHAINQGFYTVRLKVR